LPFAVAVIEFTSHVFQPPLSPGEKTVRAFGGVPGTVSVKFWVVTRSPFTASNPIEYTPSVPGRAAPESVAVPLRLSVSLTPYGSGSVVLIAGVGNPPLVVTVKLMESPTADVNDEALVIVDATGAR
jgi:hypothetical protein